MNNNLFLHKKIGDCLKICHGKSQYGIENPDGEYPILGTSGVIGFTDRYLWDSPSVLIGRKGTIDFPQYMDTPFWTIDTLFFSDIKKKYHAKFLYYIFGSINWKIFNEASGVPSLNAHTIEQISILVPETFAEQAKIAEILTTIDTVIEKTKALIAKYQAVKEGLLQDLLTNGIDKDGNVRSPETHKYKPSPLGMIPKDWECMPLKNTCSLINGRAYKQQELLDEGKYLVLRVGNLFTSDKFYFSDLS